VKLDVKKILLPNLPYVFIFWFFILFSLKTIKKQEEKR